LCFFLIYVIPLLLIVADSICVFSEIDVVPLLLIVVYSIFVFPKIVVPLPLIVAYSIFVFPEIDVMTVIAIVAYSICVFFFEIDVVLLSFIVALSRYCLSLRIVFAFFPRSDVVALIGCFVLVAFRGLFNIRGSCVVYTSFAFCVS